MRTLLGILAVVLLAAPAQASAWSTPEQRPADPVVKPLVDQAVAFFAARGVVGCPRGITVWQAPALSVEGKGAWELGDGATCEEWLSDDLVASLDFDYRLSIDGLVDACTAVAHGVGHALGLPHAPSGVMAGEGAKPPWPHAWAPYFCVSWAQDRSAAWHRADGIPAKKIKRWARATRQRLLAPPAPHKGVIRPGVSSGA
jgi:hypothetical protein